MNMNIVVVLATFSLESYVKQQGSGGRLSCQDKQ